MASTYLSLNVHLVFATKNRQPIIADVWRKDLHAYIGGTIRGLKCQALAVGGFDDHTHALDGMKSTDCVADLIREIKKASSTWAEKHVRGFAWQSGYAGLSVGYPELPRVTQHVRNQEEHHRTKTSSEELHDLLREFGIPYDERYFE